MSPGSQHQAPLSFDVTKRFVRFLELRDDGFVRFDFAVGDPELSVELTLPLPHYRAFCRESRVVQMTPEQTGAIDFNRSKWRFGQPGILE